MALQERLRPRLREDLVVVAIGGVMLAVFLAQPDNDLAADQVPRSMDWLGVLLLAVGCVSLLARRRFPLSVVVLALALEVVWNSLGYTNGAINLPALVAFYALGTTGDRAREVAAVVLTVVPLAIATVVDGQPWRWIVGNTGWPIAALLFGEVSRSRRCCSAATRSEPSEPRPTRKRRPSATGRGTAADRPRPPRPPRPHRVADDGAGRCRGRQARSVARRGPPGDRAHPGSRAPGQRRDPGDGAAAAQRRRTDARAVADDRRHRAAEPGATRIGLTVECRIAPDVGDVDALIGLTAYRIVQEALTNVVRHADASQSTS